MVGQNPTIRGCAAAALVLALGLAPGAAAQGFQIVSDGADGIWVLDAGSGEVSWCRLVTAPGAKLVDVFGFEATVREAPERPARPACDVVRAGNPAAERLDAAAFFDDPVAYGWVGDVPWRDRLQPWRSRGDVGGGSHRGDVGVVRAR